MSPHFILGLENVPCVAEVVNRLLKADCTDYNQSSEEKVYGLSLHSVHSVYHGHMRPLPSYYLGDLPPNPRPGICSPGGLIHRKIKIAQKCSLLLP